MSVLPECARCARPWSEHMETCVHYVDPRADATKALLDVVRCIASALKPLSSDDRCRAVRCAQVLLEATPSDDDDNWDEG